MADVLGGTAYGLGWLVGQPLRSLCHRPSASGPNDRLVIQAQPLAVGGQQGPAEAALELSQTNAPALLPDPGGAFEMFKKQLLELDRSGLWNPSRQATELSPLLRFLPAADYPQIWDLIRHLQSSPFQQSLEKALIASWAKADPRAALRAWSDLSDSRNPRLCLDMVLTAWGEKEPQAALSWAKQLSADRRDRALAAVISGIANTEPSTATGLLQDLSPGPSRDSAALSVVRALVPTDIEAAAALVRRLEWQKVDRHEKDCPDQRHAISEVAEAWAQRSIPDALAWAQTLPHDLDRGHEDLAFAAIFGRMVEAQQPELAVDFINSQADPYTRERLTRCLAAEWSSRDLAGAAAWLSQLPAGPTRETAWGAIRWQWVGEDLQGAVDFALQSMPSGKSRAAVFEDIAKVAIKTTLNDHAARSLADQLPQGPERNAVLKVLAEEWRWCPQEAAALVASMSPGGTQIEQAAGVAGRWAAEDPASAATWVVAFPAGKAREEAMRQVVTQWGYSDPTSAAQWLESLPADSARAKAADLYVSNLADKRPDLAAQMTAFITEESRRNEQIERTAREWSKTDPEAAKAWLEQTPLPPERRLQLLNSISTLGL